MKEIIIYTNKEDCWGEAYLKWESKSHFSVAVDPSYRTTIQFPKNLFYFEYLTKSKNTL